MKILVSYKQKYIEKCEELNRVKETYETKIRQLEKDNKKLRLSIINSKTAKNGYNEERLVCEDLNNKKEIRQLFKEIVYDECFQNKGNSKIDILSKNMELTAQVKKYKDKVFQQLDRHWVDDFVKSIPNLYTISKILKNLCEIPISDDGIHVDKSQNRKLLSTENYTTETLENFINVLNNNKRQILEYVFYGKDQNMKPKYLIAVQYVNKIRKKIKFFKIDDIIAFLMKKNFEISKSKSVVSLDKSLSFQRKGGDCGKKSSNQLQFKIIISSLDIDTSFEYNL